MQRATEAPEVLRALNKAQEYAEKAATATTAQERAEYERLWRKWVGIADGWRVITQIDKTTD
jgi:hypothetical protein